MNISAAAFDTYLDRGWLNVFALPKGCKFPPPKGVTGAAAETPMPHEIARWQTFDCNIGMRVPATVVGIDVDAADGKHGAATLKALESRLGALPATWRSTSRDDNVSGIYFFTIPAGIRFNGTAGLHIDIIQSHHRYAVVAPSTHPNGSQYRWIDRDGNVCDIPDIDALPQLPDTWIEHLLARTSHDHDCHTACIPNPPKINYALGEITFTGDIDDLLTQLRIMADNLQEAI